MKTVMIALLIVLLGSIGCKAGSTATSKATSTTSATTAVTTLSSTAPKPSTSAPAPTTSSTTTAALKPLPPIIAMAGPTGSGNGDTGLIVSNELGKQLGVSVKYERIANYVEMFFALKTEKLHVVYGGTTAIRDPWLGLGNDYDNANWGPQKVRLLMVGMSRYNGIYTTKKTGIKAMTDLKGKRVPWYPSSSTRNEATENIFKAHGFTWDDVKKVNFDSPGAAEQALADGVVDAVMTGLGTAKQTEIEATLGAYVIPFSSSAETAKKWSELMPQPLLVAPKGFMPGIEQDTLVFGSQDHIVTYDLMDADYAYRITKGLYESIPTLQKTKGTEAFTKDNAASLGAMAPFHPGSIRYFKEAGVWDAAHETWQQEKLKVETAALAAWKTKYGK